MKVATFGSMTRSKTCVPILPKAGSEETTTGGAAAVYPRVIVVAGNVVGAAYETGKARAVVQAPVAEVVVTGVRP